jgi:hypothetical protein
MTEASTRLDTIRHGNERALARLGGCVSAGVLISNSLIKILNPHWEPGARDEGKLAASPELTETVKQKGWA